ncbi:BON domain-containing protein [Paraburkholderia caballeronis]|uniref:BON domain-containing protein n=1 Tax=Paraburkholderia caballeronis TaxID=416943 RepID=UPI001FB8A247|nr:BON domain-containing protein [Paraburkholderia caballeronis]
MGALDNPATAAPRSMRHAKFVIHRQPPLHRPEADARQKPACDRGHTKTRIVTLIGRLDVSRGISSRKRHQSPSVHRELKRRAPLFRLSTARLKEPQGGSMTMNRTSGVIGAMLVVAAATGAPDANARTEASAPAGVTVQRVAVSTSPPRNRQDTSLIRDVRRALRRVPGLNDSQIHIRARHGVITLTGTVPESWQISRAGNAARSVHGVRAVSNRLTVRRRNTAAIEQPFAASLA